MLWNLTGITNLLLKTKLVVGYIFCNELRNSKDIIKKISMSVLIKENYK